MKAMVHFRDDKYSLASAAFSAIWDLFDVLETRSDISAAEGRQKLGKICIDAVDLSLMMRNSKDEYVIDTVSHVLNRPIAEHEDIVEEAASQPAYLNHPETVAFTVTGALMKFPSGNTRDRRVLEKAEAVVYH